MTEIGIAVITYKRQASLHRALSSIRKHCSLSIPVVVCDDERSDATRDMAAQLGCAYITGPNRGVCWNKNRGLYFLRHTAGAKRYLLVEDDCEVTEDGWLQTWSDAIDKSGHVNFAHPVTIMSNPAFLISGTGTAEDPYVTTMLTGQCTGGTSASLDGAGYLSNKFRGYGHGHVEWTLRCIDAGHGGGFPDGPNYRFFGLNYGIRDHMLPTNKESSALDTNLKVLQELRASRERYSDPWVGDEEKAEFLAEQRDAVLPEHAGANG